MNKTNNQRRDFIKTIGLGAATISIPFAGKAAQSNPDEQQNHSKTEHFQNGFDFEFKFSGDKYDFRYYRCSNSNFTCCSYLEIFQKSKCTCC